MGTLSMLNATAINDAGVYRKKDQKILFCANCITVPEELEKYVCSKSNEQHEIRRLRKDIQICENLMRTADENVKSITKKLLTEKAEKIETILFNQQKGVASQNYASVTNSVHIMISRQS